MDWTLILTVVGTIATIVGTVATVISTIIAVRAKNEAKDILKQIHEEKSRNIDQHGDVKVKNHGTNSGIISGVNSGDIHL